MADGLNDGDGFPEASPARVWLRLADGDLLAACEVDLYRASGPGGQKRNKTSSAVRLRHGPSGLIVTAVESRSQHENRARALRRLRQAIALTQRSRVQADDPLPTFVTEALGRDASLHVNQRNEAYLLIVQFILDLFATHEAGISETARSMGVSTGQLVRFMKKDPKLWEQAIHLRGKFGHPPLK